MPLTRQHATIFFLGAATTAALLLTLGANNAPTPTPRFLLADPWVAPQPNSAPPDHGAYRIDTQTGELLEIVNSHYTKVN